MSKEIKYCINATSISLKGISRRVIRFVYLGIIGMDLTAMDREVVSEVVVGEESS